MATELMPSDDLSLGEMTLYSLHRVSLTPEVLKQSWHVNSLRFAVQKLLQEVCFLHDPVGHAACREFWESLPETDWAHWGEVTPAGTRYYDFFCLGLANHCVNCGHIWYGVGAAARDFPALGIRAGDPLKNRCPACGESFETATLQRLAWHEMIAGTIGSEVQELDTTVRSVRVDMIFRLALFLARSGVAAGVHTLAGAEDLKVAILHKLAECGLGHSTEVYNAADWVAKAPYVLPAWGLDPEEIENTWTRNQMRTACSALNETYAILREAAATGHALWTLSDIWSGGASHNEKCSATRERIKYWREDLAEPAKPPVAEPPQAILDFGAVGYLLRRLDGEDVAHVTLDGCKRVDLSHEVTFLAWVRGILEEENHD